MGRKKDISSKDIYFSTVNLSCDEVVPVPDVDNQTEKQEATLSKHSLVYTGRFVQICSQFPAILSIRFTFIISKHFQISFFFMQKTIPAILCITMHYYCTCFPCIAHNEMRLLTCIITVLRNNITKLVVHSKYLQRHPLNYSVSETCNTKFNREVASSTAFGGKVGLHSFGFSLWLRPCIPILNKKLYNLSNIQN